MGELRSEIFGPPYFFLDPAGTPINAKRERKTKKEGKKERKADHQLSALAPSVHGEMAEQSKIVCFINAEFQRDTLCLADTVQGFRSLQQRV